MQREVFGLLIILCQIFDQNVGRTWKCVQNWFHISFLSLFWSPIGDWAVIHNCPHRGLNCWHLWLSDQNMNTVFKCVPHILGNLRFLHTVAELCANPYYYFAYSFYFPWGSKASSICPMRRALTPWATRVGQDQLYIFQFNTQTWGRNKSWETTWECVNGYIKTEILFMN